MTKTNNKIDRRVLEWGIKAVIAGLLALVLYRQVFANQELVHFKAAVARHFHIDNMCWLWAAVVLMPVNWTFETLKWQTLIRGFEPLSFWKAYRGILSGVTFSLFTPNRLGAFGGRILMVRPANNWKATIATFVGGFCQMLVLMSFGFLGLIYFAGRFLEWEPIVIQSVGGLGLILVSLMVFCFYNIDLLVPIAKRMPLIHLVKPLVQHVKVLKSYSNRTLSTALFFAFLRYVTYCLQYYFMLRFFGIEVSLLIGLTGIASIFLFQTSIPLPPVIGLLTRSQIALFVWEHYTTQQIDILSATFGLFLLNLIVPALMGLLIIVSTNVLGSLGWGK